MNSTVKTLTDLIRFGICGTSVSMPPLTEEEAKTLFLAAKQQELAHIVGDTLCRADLIPQGKTRALFEKNAFANLCRHELMTKEFRFLCELFEKEGIPYLPLKGSVLREYYPFPWMRNSCDIDILVHPEDHKRAKDLLLGRGYRFCAENAVNAALDSPSGVHFELHYRLVREEVLPLAARFLNDAWSHSEPVSEGALRYKMSDPLFYLYHIAHMAKHYLHGGCGMRPFLDLWVLNRYVPHDKAVRASIVADCGLTKFATAAEQLAEVWFGGGEENDITASMEAFVLSGGVYGSTKNHITIQHANKGGKLRYILARIFIPYNTLKYFYPVLKKHKWLFPFFQVVRWFRLIFCGGLKRSMRKLSLNNSIDSGAKKEMELHLKDLGL